MGSLEPLTYKAPILGEDYAPQVDFARSAVKPLRFKMPDFTTGAYRYFHTMASALESLYRAGVSPRQITIRAAGSGWKTHRVISQNPAPDTPLTPATEVVLSVQGSPLFETLPSGMRDADDRNGPTTKQIMNLLDDPLQKLDHLLDSPSNWFELSPDKPVICSRFIRLFGLNAEAWPKDLWFPLATFLPSLPRVGGTERGIRQALRLLLDLGVFQLYWRPRVISIAAPEYTLLSEKFSRLGTDATLGRSVPAFDSLVIVLGPVSLEQHSEYQNEKRGLVRQVLDLVLPFTLATEGETFRLRFQVGDPRQRPKLGISRMNSVLGVNSRIGDLEEAAVNA
jgi:hypothetical protein